VWSLASVVVDPAGERAASFVAVAVDRAVGPAAEQGADEAFCFPVSARSVRACAQVLDPERFAGERVDRGAIRRAVIGHQPFDPDAESGEVSDRSAEEADGGNGLLIVEDLDVNKPGRVVDADVNVLPPDVVGAPVVAAAGDAAGAPTGRSGPAS
jgi:hypothetical protein